MQTVNEMEGYSFEFHGMLTGLHKAGIFCGLKKKKTFFMLSRVRHTLTDIEVSLQRKQKQSDKTGMSHVSD